MSFSPFLTVLFGQVNTASAYSYKKCVKVFYTCVVNIWLHFTKSLFSVVYPMRPTIWIVFFAFTFRLLKVTKSVNGKNLTMFSFEGDFRTRPSVSLGGASKKVKTKTLLDLEWKIIGNVLILYKKCIYLNVTFFLILTFCLLSGGESIIVAPYSRGKTKARGIFQVSMCLPSSHFSIQS